MGEEQFPPQHQEHQPGRREEMEPKPATGEGKYRGCGKLEGKSAIITGGDSGIGRAAAIAFAREGADVAIVYLEEHEDARDTARLVEEAGRRALVLPGDVGEEEFCRGAVEETARAFGRLDVVVNVAGVQYPQKSILDIGREQLEKTFRTNIFSFFYMVKAALPHLGEGSAIINTTSVTAYQGMPVLLDYSSTKGAIVSFTRSLALNLAQKKIRVNGVAPGPIWTPLIPASFDEEQVASFGANTPLGRAGQPEEVAPCYVFLASDDSSYMTGQVLHPNGGRIVNG